VSDQRPTLNDAALLAAIVDSTPDALLVVGTDGRIQDANRQVRDVLGYEREELIEQPLELLLPERYREVHVGHRQRFAGDPHPRSMGIGLDLFARKKDGSEIPVDVALGTVPDLDGHGRIVIAFVRDVSERRRSEELARQLRDAEHARKQALEINDNVVQGVVTALMRLELDELGDSEAVDGLRKTLTAARGIISDLLGEREVEPGGLVRSVPAEG